jgi:hypothetical protein
MPLATAACLISAARVRPLRAGEARRPDGCPQSVMGERRFRPVQSGCIWGYVDRVEGITARICAEHGGALDDAGSGSLAMPAARATPMPRNGGPDLAPRRIRPLAKRPGIPIFLVKNLPDALRPRGD